MITTNLFKNRGALRSAGAWTCVVLLGGLLLVKLLPEWQMNPQYHYGFMVPGLVVLLVLRSREGREAPLPKEGARAWVALLLLVAAVLVVEVVATSNPEWRFVLWVYGLVVFFGMLLMLEWLGGWGRCFAGALGLLFFAIPWPTFLEQWVVQGLMRIVAVVTGEVCNLMGIPVDSRGNVLLLSSGELVGVEDACSGVRSLQSGLMAAYFFGRWMWLSWRRSLWLIGFAAAVAFAFNLLRATGLTSLAHFRGGGEVMKWHDFAGHSVAILVFLVLFLVSLRMEREPRVMKRPALACGGVGLPMVGLILLAGVPLFSSWWFSRDHVEADADGGVTVAWVEVSEGLKFEPIAERTRSLLRFAEGKHGWWLEKKSGIRFDLYDFRWTSGMISSFGEIHRPDVCLPASGLKIVERDRRWRELVIREKSLMVERFAFEESGQRIYVFFCAWDLDSANGKVPLVTGMRDRLHNAWLGRRVEGRRVVQLLVSGEIEPELVDVEVERLLRQVLR